MQRMEIVEDTFPGYMPIIKPSAEIRELAEGQDREQSIG
jgi:hypothetical protein